VGSGSRAAHGEVAGGRFTDEPLEEIAAAGHDRSIIPIIPIKPENVDARLRPDRANLEASYAVLEDRERPHYGHSLAA